MWCGRCRCTDHWNSGNYWNWSITVIIHQLRYLSTPTEGGFGEPLAVLQSSAESFLGRRWRSLGGDMMLGSVDLSLFRCCLSPSGSFWFEERHGERTCQGGQCLSRRWSGRRLCAPHQQCDRTRGPFCAQGDAALERRGLVLSTTGQLQSDVAIQRQSGAWDFDTEMRWEQRKEARKRRHSLAALVSSRPGIYHSFSWRLLQHLITLSDNKLVIYLYENINHITA